MLHGLGTKESVTLGGLEDPHCTYPYLAVPYFCEMNSRIHPPGSTAATPDVFENLA